VSRRIHVLVKLTLDVADDMPMAEFRAEARQELVESLDDMIGDDQPWVYDGASYSAVLVGATMSMEDAVTGELI
jgi:hypothetical protein